MNAVARLYPGDDAVRLAASVGVQIAGIVLIALAASWTIARRNAALRDGIWKAALALVCVAPFAAWTFQRAGIAVWRPAARVIEPRSGIRENSETTLHPTTEDSRLPRQAAHPPTATRSVSEESATRARSASEEAAPAQPEPARLERAPRMIEIISGTITGVWALGAVILMIRLVVGVRIVARLRRDLVPFTELPAGVVDRLRRTLGVQSLPPIMLSRQIGGPASLGLWRPVVVLPADLAAKMNPDELHDALVHECAHALRRDASIAVVQQIVAALYWLHPFIHILNRQLSRAREEVCDNVVLTGTTAANYARTLLTLSQTIQSTRGRIAVVPMFDPRWRLAQRIAGVLNNRRIIVTRITNRAIALLTAIVLTLGTALAAISAAGDQPDAKSDAKPSTPAIVEQRTSADKLQQFLEERAKLANDAYVACQVSYEAGTITLDLLLAASDDLAEANAALCKTRAELIAVREKQVRRAKELEARLKALQKVNARGGEADKVAVAGVSRVKAEIALERERREAPAATGADDRPLDAPKTDDATKRRNYPTSSGVFSKLAANDWELAALDDILRNNLVEPRFNERKAELDAREATVLLEVASYTYEHLVEANKNVPGAISSSEVRRAELDKKAAAIKLEKAELAVEHAHAEVEKEVPPVLIAFSPETGLQDFGYSGTVWDNATPLGGRLPVSGRIDPSVNQTTIKSELGDYINPHHPHHWRDVGAARVAVVRFKGTLRKTLEAADELKPTDGVALRDLVEGTAKNEIVHRGDFIVLFGGRFGKEKPAATNEHGDDSRPGGKLK